MVVKKSKREIRGEIDKEEEVFILVRTHSKKLSIALMFLQHIEETIKDYLVEVYEIIKKKLGNQIPFKFSHKSVENDSLEKLLTKFRKVNSNKKLIDRVGRLIKDRNYCAHRAYVMIFRQKFDNKYLSDEIEKFERIANNSSKCFTRLQMELKKVREIKSKL